MAAVTTIGGTEKPRTIYLPVFLKLRVTDAKLTIVLYKALEILHFW